ncbi:unnamed protein product [Symbiodinium natans]|uniref:Glucosidase II beta subunit N-terminal domain-containing protein n=1 Tax=Symbiodinium natans TaxID=878477 RepID=A0A812LYG0_9DINO|nr:unnamed protein product [Symbiodinium natans]
MTLPVNKSMLLRRLGSFFGCELRRALCLAGALVCFLWLVLLGLYAAVPEGDSRPPALRGRREPTLAAVPEDRDPTAKEGPARARDPEPEPRKPMQEAPAAAVGEPQPSRPAAAFVRGVPAELRERFAAMRAQGRFECLSGGKSFPSFSVVNDDYCDCPDGSDEPGTSACSGLPGPALPGFACTWSGGAPERLVRLGAVNDGICDCCNGEAAMAQIQMVETKQGKWTVVQDDNGAEYGEP